jgi:hypothetical protein
VAVLDTGGMMLTKGVVLVYQSKVMRHDTCQKTTDWRGDPCKWCVPTSGQGQGAVGVCTDSPGAEVSGPSTRQRYHKKPQQTTPPLS